MPKLYAIALAATGVVAAGVLLALGELGAEAECVSVGACYCESDGGRWIAQPANALSGFAYVLAGSWMIRRDNRRGQLASFAMVATSMGLAAFLYHASLREWAGKLDVLCMYGFGALIFSRAAEAAGLLPQRWRTRFWLVMWGTMAAHQLALSGSALIPLGLVIAAGVALEMVALRRGPSRQLAFGVASAGLLGVGALILLLSNSTDVLCSPNSLFQGHALWHLLGAGAAVSYCLYLDPQPRLS